jgi:hypothetical protein
VESAVVELAGAPEDAALADLVRAQVRLALAADEGLAEEIASIVAAAPPVQHIRISGGQNQIGSHNRQYNFGAPPQ